MSILDHLMAGDGAPELALVLVVFGARWWWLRRRDQLE